MVFYLRLFICNLHPVLLLPPDMYADFDRLFLVLNKLLMLGLSILANLSSLLVTHKAWLIM